MHSGSHKEDSSHNRSPLASIGLIVLAMLTVPILLYMNTPEGPMKEGDVVFSTGKQRAYFAEPTPFQRMGYETYCILEPRDQLVVVRKLPGRTDRALVAQPVGKTKIQVPFCPPKADLILKPHQANLKMDVWGAMQDAVAHLYARLWS